MKQLSFVFFALLWSCGSKSTAEATSTQYAETLPEAPATTPAPALPPSADAHDLPVAGESLQQFVPAGYFIQHEARGDINQDGMADAALVLRETADSTSERALVVVLGQAASPKYKLADAGWTAIGPQCTTDGYCIRSHEQLAIAQGAISLELYEPGPAGNLFTTYRYIAGNVQLTERATFFQGAGGASGCHEDLLTGVIKSEEINRMKEPEESTQTTKQVKPVKILLHDSNPDEMGNDNIHL
jgi:hypothetical protein